MTKTLLHLTWLVITPTILIAQQPLLKPDASPHKVQFITVAPGVSLEVVDWGGSGPPLVFLAGLGNTAMSSTILRRNSCRSIAPMGSLGAVLAHLVLQFPMIPATQQISLETTF